MQKDILRKEQIEAGETALGIELGSTRIKSVLIGADHTVLASGVFQWENRLEQGLWTYSLEEAVAGLQESYSDLRRAVEEKYGLTLRKIGAIGISGMMHGYLPLDAAGNQLAPFLTWRNTNTAAAAEILTEKFSFNIPLRWSIAQLYQAVLNGAPHVRQIRYLTTLAGYIHQRLTGSHVLGVGEAAGMFPIDSQTMDYDESMLAAFRTLVAEEGYPWDIRQILPKVLTAGENAGCLTPEGAALLDVSGQLLPGIPMAPPEGDAGTGMVATNAVAACTGNVSAGTSIFAMVVLERPLSRIYKDIDMVTTPTGRPVAMVHCNNGTSELDVWARVFRTLADRCGAQVPDQTLYQLLFEESLKADPDCGGLLLYNYPSGEPVVGLQKGRPLLVRKAEGKFSLANLMRSQIYGIFAALAVGMDILWKEQVRIERLTGHGGLFKTPGVAQRFMAAAMHAPITVLENAGEGGPYGMALLAAYCKNRDAGESLEGYLQDRVFCHSAGTTLSPDPLDQEDFAAYLERYRNGLPVEQSAVAHI